MSLRRNVLSVLAFVCATPAIVLIVRRAYVFTTSGGRNVGADFVLIAYGFAIAALVLSLVAAKHKRESLGQPSVLITSTVLGLLIAANAIGVFRAVWW